MNPQEESSDSVKQISVTPIVVQTSSGRRTQSEGAVWGIILLLWILALCFVPDPRPLAAPEEIVKATRSLLSITEPAARVVSAIMLRAVGFGLIGVFTAMAFRKASRVRIFDGVRSSQTICTARRPVS